MRIAKNVLSFAAFEMIIAVSLLYIGSFGIGLAAVAMALAFPPTPSRQPVLAPLV